MQHAPGLAHFLSRPEDGVYYVGHASLLARLSGRLVLFDYVLENKPYGDVWRFFPELAPGMDALPLDGVFVSHCHQDHLDLPLLRRLRERCPLYVLDGRPDFNSLLAREGLQPVLIPPDTRHSIAPGIDVYGLLHDSNGVDASTVISNGRFSVYHGNDNYVRADRLAVLKDVFGHIDVACIPYAYIHWYPFLLDNLPTPEKNAEAERLIHHYYELAHAQANAMGAKRVIPFGANLVYHDDAWSPMNLAVKTPLEFEAYMRERHGDAAGARFHALFTDDVILHTADGRLEEREQAFDRAQYRHHMQQHLQALARAEAGTEVPPPTPDELSGCLQRLGERVQHIAATGCAHEIRVEGLHDGRLKLAIDLQQRTVAPRHSWDGAAEPAAAYHHFKVDDSVLGQWLRAEIRFEEVIGSRKFTVSRVPNVYNPEVLRILNTEL